MRCTACAVEVPVVDGLCMIDPAGRCMASCYPALVASEEMRLDQLAKDLGEAHRDRVTPEKIAAAALLTADK